MALLDEGLDKPSSGKKQCIVSMEGSLGGAPWQRLVSWRSIELPWEGRLSGDWRVQYNCGWRVPSKRQLKIAPSSVLRSLRSKLSCNPPVCAPGLVVRAGFPCIPALVQAGVPGSSVVSLNSGGLSSSEDSDARDSSTSDAWEAASSAATASSNLVRMASALVPTLETLTRRPRQGKAACLIISAPARKAVAASYFRYRCVVPGREGAAVLMYSPNP